MLDDTKLSQTLENFWNPTNQSVLVYNAHLNKIQYEKYVSIPRISLWFKTFDGPSSLIYKYPPHDSDEIIHIYSSDLIYGAVLRLFNQTLYFLGDVITKTSPDEITLAQHMHDSLALLRKYTQSY